MIEKWVNFKRDYLEITFLRENCGYDGSDERRRIWFPPNTKGQDDNIELWACQHAVSDTFILIISERAPLEMTYISMSPKVICEGRVLGWEGGVPLPGQGIFLHTEPEKTVCDACIWGKDY